MHMLLNMRRSVNPPIDTWVALHLINVVINVTLTSKLAFLGIDYLSCME